MGLAVGSAVARFRHSDPIAAIASAVLAVLGCALGSFLALVFALAGAGVDVGSILGHLNLIIQAYPHSLGVLTLVFWLIAAYIGFRIPFSRAGLGGMAQRRGGRFPASGAPAQPWSPSQPGQPPFGPPPAGQPAASLRGQLGSASPPRGSPRSASPRWGSPGSATPRPPVSCPRRRRSAGFRPRRLTARIAAGPGSR